MANQPKPGTAVRGIRLPDDVWFRVRDLADEQGVTASDVVRKAIERYLSETPGRRS